MSWTSEAIKALYLLMQEVCHFAYDGASPIIFGWLLIIWDKILSPDNLCIFLWKIREDRVSWTPKVKYDWLHQKEPNQVLVEARYKRSTLSGLTPMEKKRRERPRRSIINKTD